MTTGTKSRMVSLNADLVGYSALLADDFEGTTATVEDYRRLVAERVEEGGGILAQFVGDSFMALFDDATDAMRTAISISAEIESRNADLPAARRVRFRMGLDEGEVAEVEGGHHGDALNIAARIQALAPPGGISVSGRVYRTLDEPALRFRGTGRHKLKNIPEPVDVYEFADLPRDRTGAGSRPSLGLETPTLTVIPIHTEGADDAVRAAAAVLRRDLVHRLASIPQLDVVDADNLVERGFAGGAPARYLLETGVHQAGDQVRVYVILLDVATMNVVKSRKWTSPAAELLALSESVAEEVARDVAVDLVIGAPAGLYAELGDPAAIDKIYLGWYHLRSDTPDGWARAVELFEEVARSHPHQPAGLSLAAFANWVGSNSEWVSDPEGLLAVARSQARAALEQGDPTGLAQAVEAAVLMAEGRADEALEAMDHLDIVRPTCDVTYGLEGSIRRYLGQWEKAVDLLDHAMRLTVVNKPWYPTVKACSLFIGGRLEEAASIAGAVVEHQSHNLEALLVLAAAQLELGLERRARATADIVRDRFPAVDVEAWLDRSPYQRREIVERWKHDLTSVGAIDPSR